MQVVYITGNDLDSTEDFLDEFILEIVDLPLGAFIWMFLGMVLNSRGLDIAEEEEYICIHNFSVRHYYTRW